MTEEKFIEILQNAVEKVKTEEDPIELNNYRKLFKKNVPFALRNYVAAFLAKSAEGGFRRGSYRRYEKDFRHEGGRFNKESRSEFDAQPSTRNVIDESLASTIFISIGRNRHVFPKDLINLITENTSLEKSRIGEIRVLDNYSFVQFYTEDCDTVIKALDGYTFRGRKLTVSFSKKKSDTANDNESSHAETFAEPDETETSRYETVESSSGSGEFLV